MVLRILFCSASDSISDFTSDVSTAIEVTSTNSEAFTQFQSALGKDTPNKEFKFY